jgi:hypothetical protein
MENSHVDARGEAAILALGWRFLEERLYGADKAQEFPPGVTSAVFDDRLVTSGLRRILLQNSADLECIAQL